MTRETAGSPGKAGGGWLRRLGGLMAPLRVPTALAFGSSLAVVLANLASPLVVQRVIDGARTRGAVAWLLVIIGLLSVLKVLSIFGRRWFAGKVSIEVEALIRRRVHDHLQTLDPLTHDALSQGQIVSRTNSDIGLVSQLLSFGPLMLANVATLVLAIVVMLAISWPLTIAVAAMVPLLAMFAIRLRNQMHPANLHAQQVVGAMATTAEEAISGVRIVKAFAQERRELARFERDARLLFSSRLRIARIQARWAPILALLPALTGLAVLGLGGRLAIAGRLSAGELVAFLTYLALLLQPIRMLGMLIAFSGQARAGAERIFEVLDLRSTVVDREGATPLPVGPGLVELASVSFEFVAGQPVLSGVSIRVEPGEVVAIVGASGSGKSTLALLLNRFFDPTSGAVRIDGHDVRDHTLESVRGAVALAFQDSFLFSDTVRANIAAGRSVSDLQVRSAAELAGADRFIRALPLSYDTLVGEQGMTLSGGQRQRVALARAVLAGIMAGPGSSASAGPRLFVLDDATSAVDAVTEAAIYAGLRTALGGRTALLIAQSRSTVALADRVVVLDGGAIVAAGTHRELLGATGDGPERYRELFGALPERAPEDLSGPTAPSATAAPGPVALPATPTATPALGAVGRTAAAGRGAVGMGSGGGWAMAATPEALSRIDSLPPLRDEPRGTAEDAVSEAERDRSALSMWVLLRRHRVALGVTAALVAADAVTGLTLPALVRWSTDAGLLRGRSEPLVVAVIVGTCVAVFSALIVRAQTIRAGRITEEVLYRLRLRVVAHLHRLGVSFHEREMSGRLLTRVVGDVDALASFWQNGVITLLSSAVALVGVSVLLVVFDPLLAVLALTALPPLAVATVWFRRRSGKSYAAIRERVATVNADLAESFNGVRVTQATAGERVAAARFAKTVAEHRQAREAAQFISAVYFPIVELLSGMALLLVLGIGATRVRNGQATTGDLAAFVLLLSAFFAPVQQLVMVFDQWQQADAAVAKLRALFAETPDLVDAGPVPVTAATVAVSPGPVPSDQAGAEGVAAVHDRRPAAVPGGTRRTMSLELRDVSFSYGPALAPVLRGINLVVAEGETVALVGETGAGKSTIVKLIARFHDPTAGVVLAGGRDLRSLGLESWRRRLGYVPQEAVLFSATLAENIAYGRPDASRRDVEAVAELIGVDRIAARLPHGYDTVVTMRGRSLSAGERQLVALARAALVDPSVLLLDEATANLDLATEAGVQVALGALTAGRTTVLVAHRLDTARRADRIVVLADGAVVEVGTHDELVARGGRYGEMWAKFDVTTRLVG